MHLRPTKEEMEPAGQVPHQFRREMRKMVPIGEYVINLEVGKKIDAKGNNSPIIE